MSIDPNAHENPGDRPQPTLGDVLYADKAKARLSETDWCALVRSIADRDQSALYALYDRAHRIVFTLAMRIINNRETAEEITLDVFHDVWRRAADYEPANGTVVGWIMNQARSRAIDRLRREQRKKRVDPHAGSGRPPATAPENSEDLLELSEQRRLLGNLLTVLTPEERRAIETAFFSDLTHTEVAARLGQPLGTIKTRIRSGLAKLRQALHVDVEGL